MNRTMKRQLLLDGLTKRLNDAKGDLGRMEIWVYDSGAIDRVKIKMAEIQSILDMIDDVNREYKGGTL